MKFVLRGCTVLALCCCVLSFGFAQSKTDENKTLLPSTPAAAPDPAPAKAAKDPHVKPGSDFPHEELSLDYSYVHFSVGSGHTPADFNGGSASFAYNFNRRWGLVGDFGGYHAGDYSGQSIDANTESFLFGPRLSYRNDSRWTPFAQILLGGAHGHASASSVSGSSNTFAMTAGGGLDLGLNRRFAIRLFQLEYFMTRFNPNFIAIAPTQNNLRASAGLVIRWGYHPIAINQPPTAACSVNPSSVTIGSPTLVMLTVNGSDPDGDSLTYSYSATGGAVNGNGPNARWELAGLNPGNYSATAQVNDGHGGMASCSASATVNPRPNRPPTVTLGVDRDTVLVGDCVNFTAVGNDPDGDRLTYTWTSNGGQLTPTGTTARLCTTALAPGSYTTTVRVDDGRGGAADASKAITVQAPPPVQQPASKINECAFKPATSARVDNVCKRILDDVATRMQTEAKATVVVIGYADPKARRSDKIASDRGQNTLKYLQSKGIDASRVTVRSGSGQVGAGAAHQRVELIWVPEGATY